MRIPSRPTPASHLWREVNFCIQEITNLQLWENYPLGYANIVTNKNYLKGRDEEEARWYSLVPAIVIKRHRILEHRYDTSVGEHKVQSLVPTNSRST